MTNPLAQIQPFIYTNATGLKLEVLFVLDQEKKGYINATAIAKQFGKDPYGWLRNENVQEYINSLIKSINSMSANSRTSYKSVTYEDLVMAIYGSSENGGGTWLHPKLAVVFARWLSPDFAVWCDDVIAEILHNPTQPPQQFPELVELFTQALAGVNQRLDQQNQALQRLNSRLDGIGEVVIGLQHMALFQPMNTEERVEKVIDKYQKALETMLHNQQDELITGYLSGIKDNLAHIAQRVPQISTAEALNAPISQEMNPYPESEPKQEIKPASALVSEIQALRAAGNSWNGIAQRLNAQGTATPSGKGKWYGNSVKRYAR